MKKRIKQKEVFALIKSGRYDLAAEELLKVMEPEGVVADSPSAVWKYLRPYSAKRQEHFIAVFLNNKNNVIGHEVISKGTISETLVHPREVFRPAIERSSSFIIIAHNHPSDVLTPSREDEDVTKRLIEAGKVVGIRIIDHIILGKKSFFSMGEQSSINFL